MIFGNFLKSLAELIHFLIQAYIIIIIIRSIISWMGHVPYNQFIYFLRRLTDPVFKLVHKYLPFTIVGGLDISPVIIILILYFVDSFIYSTLIGYSFKLIRGG